MASEDAELLRKLYDAWNAGDFEAARPYIHPDIVWRPTGRVPGFEPVYHGPEGVWEFWQTMMEAWEEMRVEIDRVVEESDRLVVAVHFDAIGKGSGARVELQVAHVWRVVDGKVVSYSAHATFDEALAQARGPN